MGARRTGARLTVALAAGAASLLFAAPALAGTIRYQVEPSSAYTVTDNDTGIVKVTYTGCLVAGTRTDIRFTAVVSSTNGGRAVWDIMSVDGPVVNGTFDPPEVTLSEGGSDTFPVTLSFDVSAESPSNVDFRAKLDPESGEGLGEGPGILVRVPCVVAAEGRFAPPSRAAQQEAVCIPRPARLRLRAGRRKRFGVKVTSGENVVQGARVRVTLPGGVRVTRRTNARGVARFKVRPRRRGRVTIQANTCAGARQFAVRGAAAAAPRFTG